MFRNLFLQTRLAGFLTAVLLIAGLNFFCSGPALAGASVSWNGTFDGTFTIDGQESYPGRDAKFISSSEGFKKVLTSSFSNSVYIDDVASGSYRSLGEKTWLPGARWPYGQDTFRYGSDTDPVRFYGSDRIYSCGSGIKCIYLRIVPNSEVLESIRKAGQVKKLVVNYVINDRLGASATLVATFKFFRRPDPLITIEPVVPRTYVVRDDSKHQVRLRLSGIPEDPFTVHYQLSTHTFFDDNVIDKSIDVGQADANGKVPLEYLLNILDVQITRHSDFRNTISIRLVDSDGDTGPNGYFVPKGGVGNNLSMTIVNAGRLPTVRVLRHFSYINNPNPAESDAEVRFEFVANHPKSVSENIVVHYEVTQTGEFISPAKIGKFTATIPKTNSIEASLDHSIPIIKDDYYEPPGEITITVLDDQSAGPPKYKVVEPGINSSPTATISVRSKDTKPVVSIVPPSGNTVKEGDVDGGFMVTATGKWTNEFTVDFTLTEQGGTQNFIEPNSPTTLTFPPNTIEDSVSRPYNPIHIDSTVESGSGSITAILAPVTDDDHYTLGTSTTATATAEGNEPGVSLSWADGESGGITDRGLDNYEMIFGNSLVAFPITGTFELEVSARQSGMTGTDPDTASSASAVSGFSREVGTDYGKWQWQDDDSGFRFDPDADAINRLGNEVVTTTLFVRIVDAFTHSEEHMESIGLTITGTGTPELSIRSAGAVTETDGAVAFFTVTSDVNPRRSIEVNYTPVATGNFLLPNDTANPSVKGHTSGTMTSLEMEFADQSQIGDGSGPYSYQLSVPLYNNSDLDSGNHSVTVTLNSDASGLNYKISTMNSSASVTIIDDDTLPVLALAETGNPTEFDESDPAGAIVFKITASDEPLDTYPDTAGVEIDVRYAVSQSGNFIRTVSIVPDEATTAKLNFYDSNGTVMADLSIFIDDDNVRESTGLVRVTLMAASGELFYYKLGTDPERNSHEVRVYDDDAPELSVSINDVLFIEGAAPDVQFTVTSRVNVHSAINVEFNVWESYPSAQDTPLTPQVFTGTYTSPVNLDFSTSKTQSISIPIIDISDPAAPDRFVNVTLETGTGYTVASTDRGGSARTIVAVDSNPELFITDGSAVTEANNAVARFTVTSIRKPTVSSIEVNYTPTETGSFLDPSTTTGNPHTHNTPKDATMSFEDRSPAKDNSGPFTYELEIPLRNNEDTNSGAQSVSVTLNPDTNGTDYRVSTTHASASVTIIDDESLPVLTLEESSNPAEFYESDAAGVITFRITASSMPLDAYPETAVTIEIDVRYTPSQTGDFIDTSNGIVLDTPTISKLTFADSGGTVTADLSIPIAADNIEEPDGSVGIALLDADTPLHHYKLGADAAKNSHIVTVHDGDASTLVGLPELSITAGNPVTESDGAVASYTVTSDSDPGTSEIPVNYTPTETGSFLDPFPSNGTGHSDDVQSTVMMGFSDQSPAKDGSGPFIFTLNILLLDNGNTDSGAQSVTVTLNQAANGTDYAVSTENSSASVTVIDFESLPVLTLEESGNPLEIDEPDGKGLIIFKFTASTIPMDAYPDTSGVVEIDVRHEINQTGDFLDTTKITPNEATTTKLTFTESNGIATADLAIPITGDDIGEPTGWVRVSLLNAVTPAFHYKLGSDVEKNSHEVKIYDNEYPELSVSIAKNQFTEGEATYVKFTVTSRFNVAGSLEVKFNVWESDPTDSHIASDTNLFIVPSPNSSTLNFNGTNVQYLDIPIDDDRMQEGTTRYVNVTLNPGTGYTVSGNVGSARILVLDNDGTVNVPILSISQLTDTVTEANNIVAAFTVTSNFDPGAEAIQVHYTVTATGEILLPREPAAPDLRTNNGHNSGEMESVMMAFDNGGTGTGPFTYSLEIPLRDNGVLDVRAHPVTVTLNEDADGTDYQVSGASSARILVVDENEDALPFANITSTRESYTEGEDIVFNVSMSPAQDGNVRVSLRVSQRGDFIPWPITKSIQVPSSGAVLKISTVDDDVEERDGSVTAEVLYDEEYQQGTSGTVAIMDNDSSGSESSPRYSVASSVITMILKELPPTPPLGESQITKPTVSIKAVMGTVKEGEPAIFSISASNAVSSDILVNIELSQSGDFVIGPMQRLVDIKVAPLGMELVVKTDDDGLAEPDGWITATIRDGSGYLVGAENTAHVIVSDASDRQHRKNRVFNAMQAVLPDLLAHSTARTLDIASERVTQAISGSSVSSIELNGNSPVMAVLQSGGEMLNGSDTDWRSFIDDSSFTVALYPDGVETSPATVWGVGDRWSLSNDGIGRQQFWYSGTHTGHFGFDARVGHGILAGLAMSVSNTEIDYGRVENSRMSFGTLTTGAHPYLGLATPDGNSQLQIMAGYGESELELRQEEYSPINLRGNFQSLGLSGSNRLYSNGSFGGLHNLELRVAGEAWYAQQFVDSVEGIADSLQANASLVRFVIEGVHDQHLGIDGTVSPSVSIGLRGDRRNEKSEFWLNVDNEIKYDAFEGLEILGSGKSLLSGLNQVDRWKFEGSLDYDSGKNGKGLLFNISSTWSGTDARAERYIREYELMNDYIGSNDGGSIEIGYGFEVLSGSALMTPYYAINQTDIYGREHQIGNRFKTNTGIDFEMETYGSITESRVVGHKYNLTGNINW